MTSSLADIHAPALGPGELESALAAWGVIRVPVDHFHVGSFRYTNALDALAEAKRQRDQPVPKRGLAASADGPAQDRT